MIMNNSAINISSIFKYEIFDLNSNLAELNNPFLPNKISYKIIK